MQLMAYSIYALRCLTLVVYSLTVTVNVIIKRGFFLLDSSYNRILVVSNRYLVVTVIKYTHNDIVSVMITRI